MTNQSAAKFLSTNQNRAFGPCDLCDVTNAHIWAWFDTWPHGIKNTRTQELNLHSWHSFNDRVKPGYKRDVCDALMTSRPFFCINTYDKDRGFASWRKKSWAGDEANWYNGWTLSWTMVWINGILTWKNSLKTNQKEGWLDPRSKLNEKQSTIGTHEAVV